MTVLFLYDRRNICVRTVSAFYENKSQGEPKECKHIGQS